MFLVLTTLATSYNFTSDKLITLKDHYDIPLGRGNGLSYHAIYFVCIYPMYKASCTAQCQESFVLCCIEINENIAGFQKKKKNNLLILNH